MQKYRTQHSMEMTSFFPMRQGTKWNCSSSAGSSISHLHVREQIVFEAVPEAMGSRLSCSSPGALAPTFQLLLVRHVALDEQRPLRFKLLVQGRLALLSRLGVAIQQGYLSGEGGKWVAGGWMDRRTGPPRAEPSRAEPRGLPPPPARRCRLEAEGREREDALARPYLGALAQQRLDESPADALRPAGDQSHLAIDVHGRPLLPPAQPEQPSAVSPARLPFSLLRALLPPALPPSLLLPLPPPFIPPLSPLVWPRAARSCRGGGSRGGAGH